MTDDDTFLATPAAVSPTPTTRTGVPPIPTAGTGAGADPSPAALLAPQTSRLAERRAQLGDHGGLVCNISDDLADDVDDLWGQEGWDPATAAGALEWAGDCGMVFRALRVRFRLSFFSPRRRHERPGGMGHAVERAHAHIVVRDRPRPSPTPPVRASHRSPKEK